ncbi:MAG: VWA domain-containing protein [Solirubrobacteraceae bacterium]
MTAGPAVGFPVSVTAAADEFVGRLSHLAAAMRERGARLGLRELLTAVRCVDAIDCTSREDVRLALRAVLCSRRSDLERFDEAFTEVFGSGWVPPPADLPLSELGSIEKAALPRAAFGDPQTKPAPTDSAEPVPAAWSAVELLFEKDFARYTEGEMALAHDLMARLARRHPMRLSRRTRASRRRGHSPDLRGTVQASLRTAGEPIQRRWRAPTQRPRQLVLVCDVSGSMAPYSRMLLQYMQASVAARRRVEAFAFGTRLTRITHELNGRDPDRALERAVTAVSDMSGGTRIGDALSTLNRVHGRRLGRGSVVVILSDGWDRGDSEQLRTEMARLRRAAFKLVWLNPLAAHPAYEPLTRGMQAAVPHTDRLLAGNSIASLQELAEILEAM